LSSLLLSFIAYTIAIHFRSILQCNLKKFGIKVLSSYSPFNIILPRNLRPTKIIHCAFMALYCTGMRQSNYELHVSHVYYSNNFLIHEQTRIYSLFRLCSRLSKYPNSGSSRVYQILANNNWDLWGEGKWVSGANMHKEIQEILIIWMHFS
jgi:hypothetical protein